MGKGLVDALISDREMASFFDEESEVRSMLRVEAALAQVQASLGRMSTEAADTIEAAAASLAPPAEFLRERMALDGVPVPALVQSLRAAVPASVRGSVHLGATSQDIVDTALMLRLKVLTDEFGKRLGLLLTRLEELSREQGHKPLMAFTRMQPALPFSGSDKLNSWRRPLAVHQGRLRAFGEALPVQLGGPIGTGNSLGDDYLKIRALLAQRLGLVDADPWHSDRTRILEFASLVAALAGTLGKIGQDLALMAQLGTVKLEGGGASSAMPHKQNPVGAELLVTIGRLNAGLLGTVAQAMTHENERSGASWTLEWIVLPQMVETTGAAVVRATDVLRGMRITGSTGGASREDYTP
jgi:3-carboxy-cis,cis-muconate cycloisomerase